MSHSTCLHLCSCSENGTPGKRPGRRRYETQDARQDAPFATVTADNVMFKEEEQKVAEVTAAPLVDEHDGFTGRQQPIKPHDGGVFQ